VLVTCTFKLAAGGCLGLAGVIPQVAPPSRRVGSTPDQSILSLSANGRGGGRVPAVMAATARATLS
jgi:hypothetical protein